MGSPDRVRDDVATAQKIGVKGVPFFVFDGRLAVSGAQPRDVFRQALEQTLTSQRN
ncbi:DsbA family protein [Dietzia alimentaria]|uniref:DsbA family protein n=1 Tax=Dietzia alimentaria TaxID=665550 RepID=UPI0009DA1460